VRLLHGDRRGDRQEPKSFVQPGSVRVTEEDRERRPHRSRADEHLLDNAACEPAPAMFGIHDHAADPDDRETGAGYLDFGGREARRGDQPARVFAKCYMPILRSEPECYPGRIERIKLVTLELGSLLVSQSAELNDLHSLIQSNAALRTTVADASTSESRPNNPGPGRSSHGRAVSVAVRG